MKLVNIKEKMSKNPRKKHVNKLIIEFVYEKGSITPDGVNIQADCTTVDMILGMVRLMEVVSAKQTDNGKGITDFIANCMDSYAKGLNIED